MEACAAFELDEPRGQEPHHDGPAPNFDPIWTHDEHVQASLKLLLDDNADARDPSGAPYWHPVRG